MTSPAAPPLTTAQRIVVTFGLPPAGDDPASAPLAPLDIDDIDDIDETELRSLVNWAGHERLDGLLWSVLTSGDGLTAGASDDTHNGNGNGHGHGHGHGKGDNGANTDNADNANVDRLRQQASDSHVRGLRSSLAAEAAAVAAVDALDATGIDVTLFKGLANAHLDYTRPEHRTFFDADLLVARNDFGAAVDALVAAGFTRSTPPIRERWEQRFARATELRSPDGIEIDLHASLATGYFGERLDHDALRANADWIQLAGRRHRTFGPAERLLISSYSIVLSRGPGVRLLRDLAQQLLVTGADWRRAAELAGDGDVVVARGLIEAADRLGFDHEAVDWARTVAPTRTAARALAYADDAHHQGWSADARSTMLALGQTERIRFLAGVVLPSRANLRARGRTITDHLSRPRRPASPHGEATTDSDA